MSDQELVVGVDIGGTKVAAGLVDTTGEIVYQVRKPMITDQGAEAGLASVQNAIQALSDSSQSRNTKFRAIGICSPGPLDPKAGIIINPPNVPCWREFALAAEVAKAYDVPVRVDNDANAAALAEARWGAGRGYSNIFYATIGTGIGSGIVFDGQIYHGRTGAAGEGGHISIDYRGPRCGCGKLGCIEAFAAGPAIARRARAKLHESSASKSKIVEFAGGNIEAVTSEMVGKAYMQEDALANEILKETVEFLALWLGNIIDLLDPEVIILGGGVASMLNPFLEALKNSIPRHCLNSHCREVPLVKAHYGVDSGIAGGAALCSKIRPSRPL